LGPPNEAIPAAPSCPGEPRRAHSCQPGTSEDDVTTGVARALVDRIDDIVRPRWWFENVIDERRPRVGKPCKLFLRDDNDRRLASDTDMLRTQGSRSFHNLTEPGLCIL
jgi:hypothetical protein